MRTSEAMYAHLELVHDGYNFSLQSFVSDFPATEVNLVANKDYGHLYKTCQEERSERVVADLH